MPGIHLMKRRWAISSDDFVFPSFAEICLRIAWLLTISVLFGIHHGSFGCPNGYLLHNYYVGTIVILCVGIVHAFATMLVSMRGTIRDSKPRRHLHIILYLKLVIIVPEVVWIIIATYWAFGHSYTCDRSVYWAARGAVVTAWIVGFWMIVGILLVFDPLGSAEQRVSLGDRMSKKGSEYVMDSTISKNMKVWEMRCRCLCCCIAHSQDNDQGFSDVSKLVADYFKDIDVVPTDIAAGLMLVEQEQRGLASNLSTIVISSEPAGQSGPATVAVSVSDRDVMTGGTPSWMTIPVMAHYMKFALGSYGWPFYMYSNLFTGVCRLCAACSNAAQNVSPRLLKPYFQRLTKHLAYVSGGVALPLPLHFSSKLLDPDARKCDKNQFPLCCGCIRQENQVYSDNICECHTAAIKQLTKVRDQDLIYVSYHNRYREIPFYVAVDRKFNNVVVSIRGTLSLQDALTDLSARGVPLPIDGVPDATCHDAMLDCAQFIKSQLEGKQLLDRAFCSLQEGSQLVVVGHSLGAGVAAILAVLLRPQYNNLACFAFSPPGGLMSPSASRHARDFVCSVIVGEDIIPRLGMPSMCDMKIKVLKALCNSNVPKYKILATGCFRILCSCLQSASSTEDTGEISPLTVQQQNRYSACSTPLLHEPDSFLQNGLKCAEDYAKEMLQMEWPVHPPGHILHIVEEEENKLCSGGPVYTAVWAQPEDFTSILISHKMVLDHFPDVVLRALTQLSDRNFEPRVQRVTGDVNA